MLRNLRSARSLASRLERTESGRDSHPASLRVQVVTEECVAEWLRFYNLVVGLLEAERAPTESE